MIVCLCNNISESDIEAAITSGCQNFDEIINQCNFEFQCRTCEVAAKDFYKDYKQTNMENK
jgi:bacterioferritin-associated ferredoxin